MIFSIRDKFIKSIGWSALDQWGTRILSFVVLSILARLLEPHSFGILAVALVFTDYLEMFVSQGIGFSIIQRKELEKEHLNVAFWLNLGSGVLLGLLLLIVAPLIAKPFGKAELTKVLQSLSPLLLISGISTPFTDVVLVLLIIFMIATPFIYQSSVKVQLPKASKSEESSRDIMININAQGEVFLEDAKLDLETLKYRLTARVKNKPDTSVIINGDKNVRYDAVIQVMDVLTQAGVKNPGLGIELKK